MIFPFHRRLVPALACLASAWSWGAIPSACAQPSPLDHVSIVPITDNNPATNELGRDRVSINSTPFKNESMVTVGDYQFTTYYRDDGKLMVARRNLTAPTNDWDIRLTEFTSFNINDAHNVPVIGIDGDGFLHLAWGTHGNPLLYTRSTTPVTGGQALSLVGDTVGNSSAINTMTGSNETGTTYPNFIRIPGSGDLLFNYRTGGSGNGTYRIARYQDATDTWTWADQTWIGNTDSSGLTYNAYPHNMSFDSQGGLHASWTYRYNSSSPTGNSGFQTNHNLFYAYSPDHGATWFKDLAGTIPYPADINEQNSQVIVNIPEGSSLINTGTQAIDAHDRPAIATWWAPRANDPTPDHRRQYMFVGHNGNDWFTSQITHRRSDPNSPVPESSLGLNHMGRPQIVLDDYNRAYVVYKDNDNGGGVTVAYSQAASRDDWEFLKLTTTDLGYYEPTLDRALWDASRQMHLLTQTIDRDSGNGGSPVQIVQWDASSALGRVLRWTGQNSSTWDASTVNFADAKIIGGGTAEHFDSFDHVTFDNAGTHQNIHFAGPIEAGKVVIDSTQAYTFSGPGSLTAGSLSVVGGGSLELATSNNSYQGPTRVSHAVLKITGDANAMTSTLVVADRGTLIMDAADAANMASRFEIWPTGTLQIGTGTSSGNVFPDSPTEILNDGLIRLMHSETLSNVSGMGRLEAAAGTVALANNDAFAGEVRIKSAAAALPTTLDGLGSAQSRTIVEAGGRLQLGMGGTYQQQFELAGDGGGTGALHVTGGASVTLANTVAINGPEATLHIEDGASAAIDRAVVGPGGLIKRGGGVLSLAGFNSYVGDTTVDGGTLIVHGATGLGDTTVNAGGVFESGGEIRGNLLATSGAVVRVTVGAPTATGVLYEERFSRSAATPLNGLPPDSVPGTAVWTAHPGIASDGSNVSIAGGTSATLPLEVESGRIYTLDATLLDVSGDSDWFAIGFLEGLMNGGTGNGNRFISDPTTGKAWMIFRGDNSTNANQTFLGSASSGTVAGTPWPTLNDSGGDIHLRIILDASGGTGNFTAEFQAKRTTEIDYHVLRGPVGLNSADINAVGFAVSNSDVTGNVDFFRLMHDSEVPVDPLSLVVNGDFTMDPGATLEMDVSTPANLERLTVLGNFTAAGTLDMTLAPDAPPPSLGDTFDILDFGSATGSFDTLILPMLSTGLSWDTSALMTTGALSVVEGLPGDFDGDASVQGADFLLWQRSPTVGDLADWETNFGTLAMGTASTVVPEPTGWILTTAVVCFLRRHWVRSCSR
jgi:autotransporter-associated beta strand protein